MLRLNNSELEAVYRHVIDSGVLGKASRKKKIFEYLWKHASDPEAPNITQYSIAFDILERPTSFNPEIDGIVRTEIGRLRRALYTFSVQNSDYAIQIPKGKYELVISKKDKRSKFYKTRYALALICALALGVLFIGNLTAPPITSADNTSDKFICYDKLPILEVVHISAETEVSQFVLTTIEGVVSQNSHVTLKSEECRSVGVPHYLLDVTTVQRGNKQSVLLSTRPLGVRKNLALTEFSVAFDQANSYENLFFEIARNVNDMIKPYGLLAHNSLQQEWGNPVDKDNYVCFVKMYNYYASETDEDYLDVHTCLLESEKNDQAPLDIQGALVSSYLEQAKSYRIATEENPFSQAEAILSRNQGLINQSAELMMAKMAYEAERPNFSSDQMDEALLTAESSFSTNPVVLMTASGYAGLKLGDWERATRLSDRMKRSTKQRDQSLYVVDAFNVIMSNESDVNVENCFKYHSENSVTANLVVKACANKFDDKYWQIKTDKALSRLGFQSAEAQIAFLEGRDWHASLINPMIALISN